MNSTCTNLRFKDIHIRRRSLVSQLDILKAPIKSLEYEDHYDICAEEPPTYDSAMSETVLKRWVAMETVNVDTAERLGSVSSLSSLSSDGEDEYVTVADIPSLLTEIKLLKKEQEDMKQKQMAHEQHLKALLEREPSLYRRLECVSQQDTCTKEISRVTQLSHQTRQMSNQSNENVGGLSEDIYIQLEQIYVNSRTFAFKKAFLDSECKDFCHEAMKKEILLLREENRVLKDKVQMLEGELKENSTQSKGHLSPPVHSWGGCSGVKSSKSEGRLNEAGRVYLGNDTGLAFVVGKPTPPLPTRVALPDIKHLEAIFKWTVTEYTRKLVEEQTNISAKQVSSPFYLSHCGYRCQLETYLNGNGTAKNRCMSVFLRVIKGDYDRNLVWPVNVNLEIVLINQSETRNESLKASGNQFQYQKPSGVTGAESESWGLVEFVTHDVIRSRNYIRDDQIMFKCRLSL
ncbi:TNF receptor-associated factor 5 [Bulinus truncatus]|nr:TNF receptor-associated factor 5 [Bulinus truncatus]